MIQHSHFDLTRVSLMALVSILSAVPGRATQNPSDETPKARPASSSAKIPAVVDSASPETNFAAELQQLKEAVNAQAARLLEHQKELEAERENLRAALQRISSLEAALHLPVQPADRATPEQAREAVGPNLAQSRQDTLAARLERIEDRLSNVGPFRFSGDIRLRGEPSFGGPANQSMVRDRERFRFRFNANVQLDDSFSGGFSLSSGDLNDPTSTNQTANQFFTRKAFNLDRAFLSYNPSGFRPLTLTGGKFAYPWYNTELTWDKDLNPEGLAQTLAFDFESHALLKRVALVGFELPFAETAGVSLANRSITASAVYGGQLQTRLQLGSRITFSGYGAFYNWHNADPIALAVSTANSASPVNGLLPLKSTNLQNSLTVTTASQVIQVDGQPNLTGVSRIVTAQFASRFALLDAIARFDFATPSERWPIALIGDFVQNTRACANAASLAPAPPNTSSTVFSQTVSAPCNSRQRRGYWAEARFGRAQEKGDWQFAYTRMFIEREAVLSVFNYSEMRQGSNVTQHRVEALYQLNRNVHLDFIGLFGRPLNFASTAPPENFLKRLQFDVTYQF